MAGSQSLIVLSPRSGGQPATVRRKGDRPYGDQLPAQTRWRVVWSQEIPELGGAIETAGGQDYIIGREIDVSDACPVPFERMSFAPITEVPDLGDFIMIGYRQPLSVRGEAQTVNPTWMAFELADLLSRCCIPQANGLPGPSDGERFRVARKCHPLDLRGIRGRRQDRST